jgi:uncharacterized protein (DUF885 family)
VTLKTLAAVTAAIWLAACSGKHGSDTTAQADDAAAKGKAAAGKLDTLVEQYWDEYVELNPLVATLNGDNRFNDRLENNIGPEYLARSLELDRKYLAALNGIDPQVLTGQSRLTYDTFRLDREDGIAGAAFPVELLPLRQTFSIPSLFAQMGAGSGLHPFGSVKDYDDWLKRVNDFVTWSNQAIENMRAGVNEGVVQPHVVMERVLPQLEAMLVTDPKKSVFYRPVEKFPDSVPEADRKRLEQAFEKAIREQIVPAYQRMYDYVDKEYLASTRPTVGLDALPDGQNWYRYLVRLQTTTSMTPDEIHQLGLKEVARIRSEMDGVMKQVGFKGDLPAFFAWLRKEPRFYESRPEALLDDYRGLKSRVKAELPKLFAIAPKADFEIRPVEEFRARSASSASYLSATPDGSRPGVFYVNTYDLRSRPTYSMESIYLHEAEPGHHFQLSIQQELEALPRFRRFGGYTAFIEGWGLYSESLGDELGLYTDPYSKFGALGNEIFRAVRLVVDTGLHSRGWTREQAIEYMNANAPIGPSDAVSEIERYIANPGQALAYKVGELRFKELRARAQKELGPKFDVRALHTQFLDDGALPLDVLDAKIDRWIATQK